MQRLFSMFPAGRPGIAILLLRTGLSLMLLAGVLGRGPTPPSLAAQVLVWSVAALLFIGLFTPIGAALCFLIEIVAWFTYGGTPEAVHVCALLNAAALFLLGPGGYSMDARIFGRRQLVLPRGHPVDED